jgi:hypothetical protein
MFLIGRAVTRDWRVGLAAAVAMAVAAPFRYEADSLVYISYDMPLKVWCWLFIIQACRSSGFRRAGWITAASLGAFITIACSGFEMVPAIAVFSVFAPFLLMQGAWLQRSGAAVMLGCGVAMGFVAGMFSRIVHNSYALGSISAVLRDYRAAFLYRSVPAANDLWHNRSWPEEMTHRLVAYYPVQLAFLVSGLLVLGVAGVAGRQRPRERVLATIAILFGCDVVYGLLMRQHVWIHTHTTTHLCTSLSLAIGVVVVALWTTLQWQPARFVTACAACVAALACVCNLGVQPYGNNERYSDPGYYLTTFKELTKDIPADAVVECHQSMGPTPLLYLNRTFLWRHPVAAIDLHGRPLYFLTAKCAPAGEGPYPPGEFDMQKTAEAGDFRVYRLVRRHQVAGISSGVP